MPGHRRHDLRTERERREGHIRHGLAFGRGARGQGGDLVHSDVNESAFGLEECRILPDGRALSRRTQRRTHEKHTVKERKKENLNKTTRNDTQGEFEATFCVSSKQAPVTLSSASQKAFCCVFAFFWRTVRPFLPGSLTPGGEGSLFFQFAHKASVSRKVNGGEVEAREKEKITFLGVLAQERGLRRTKVSLSCSPVFGIRLLGPPA